MARRKLGVLLGAWILTLPVQGCESSSDSSKAGNGGSGGAGGHIASSGDAQAGNGAGTASGGANAASGGANAASGGASESTGGGGGSAQSGGGGQGTGGHAATGGGGQANGGRAGAQSSGGRTGSGGTPSGDGGSTCPDVPCPSGKVCKTTTAGAQISSRLCVDDPCAPQPLNCSCASKLCSSGQLCMTSADGVTCGTRCAAPDTPIATPFGDRPIASLAVGDLVLSVHRGRLVAVPIVETVQIPVRHHRVVELTLGSGKVLHVSGGHPTADGRILGDVQPGDHLGSATVLSTSVVDYDGRYTYDILPDSDSGSYISGGALLGSTLVRATQSGGAALR